MNETIALMHRHRSIRRYAADPLPDDDVRRAVEAGQRASTSSAVQSYCVIRVRDAARRRRLVELTGGQSKVAECGGFFAICGDTRRHRLAARRAGRPYAAGLEAFLLSVIDAALFAQNMALALESMGYGVCYIGGLRNDLPGVDRLLEIPEGVYPFYGLCAGVPDESPLARPRLPVEAVLCDERYPDDATMLALLDRYDADFEAYVRARDGRTGRWSDAMAAKFAEPRRTSLAAYYRSKGAGLD